MLERDYKVISDLVEVRRSPLHGYGVFVKKGMTLPAQTWVAWYPGIRKKYRPDCFYEYGLRINEWVYDAGDPKFQSKR